MLTCILTMLRKNLQYHQNTIISDQEFEIPNFLSYYWHRLSGIFSRPIMILTNMNINFSCATTESDEPRILKSGFWRIKTVIYANVFHDLIKSFALGYLKFYRHVLVSDATSTTKNWAERWRIMLTIQWISILCLLSVTNMILDWSNMNTKSWGQ